MALSAVKTFVAGEPLFASDLNDMNTNILHNGLPLISPLTGALDANSQVITSVGALGFADGGSGSLALARSGIGLVWNDDTRDTLLQNTLAFNQTTVGNVGSGEDDLMSLALEASFFAVTNRCIRIVAGFTFADTANTKTLKIKLGSSTYTINDVTAAPQDVDAIVDVYLYRPSASHQTLRGSIYMASNAESMPYVAWTETETGALTLKFTGSATADNDIVQNFMAVTLVQ